MTKKIIIALVVFISVFTFVNPILATKPTEKVQIDFFYSKTCPVCAKEKVFLNDLDNKYPEVLINRYDIAERETIDLIQQYYNKYSVPQDAWGLVPITFIGEQVYLGFGDTTKDAINNQVLSYIDPEEENNSELGNVSQIQELNGKSIKIPFLGEFHVSDMSPFVLSVAVGLLDGFNACAMVALGILLAILISTGVRKRVIIIGGTFIFVSGLVYYIFIAAWLNVFLFLGYIKIITYIVSVIIIVFSLFLLKDYINGVVCKICKVDPNDKEGVLTKFQRYLFAKANRAVSSEMPLILMVLSVAIIAAGINMVELFCSLGFPLAYTKILSSYNLPTTNYYLYLLVYVIFYMIDDFLIFLAAVFTLRITKVSENYLKFIKLISGIVLLCLGLIMLFKPDILIF